MKTTIISTLSFASLLALLSGVAIAQPYSISADGQEVTDLKTGLIWRRCAEGMTYSGGTCNGQAGAYTHEQALQQAVTVSSNTGTAWYLPNVKELASIVDISTYTPAINATVFPATPTGPFWSSSPYAVYSACPCAWVVNFNHGDIVYTERTTAYLVRLVRAGQ